MRCIFLCRFGAQYSLLRKHSNSQTRRQHPQTQRCPGSPIPQLGHVQPSRRLSSFTHQTRQRSCFPSLDRTAPSRLSFRVQPMAPTPPASPWKAMTDSRLARRVRRSCRIELLAALPARQDRRAQQPPQAMTLEMLKVLLRTPAISA